jgi:hypothetical protein
MVRQVLLLAEKQGKSTPSLSPDLLHGMWMMAVGCASALWMHGPYMQHQLNKCAPI